MSSVRPCLLERPHGLRPDTVKREEAVEIRGKVRDGEVTGVEDGAAIVGVDHAPRIGTASSNWLSDARVHTDRVDLDPSIYGWNARRMKRIVIGGGVDAVNTFRY
jgi:hypothetical protein